MITMSGILNGFLIFCILGIASGTFDFRSSVTPSGDESDFFNIDDVVELMCTFDPQMNSYAVQIRVNDTSTGSMTRLSFPVVAEGSSVMVAASVNATLDPSSFQCFASHNDPDGVDQSDFFTVLINPFFTFTIEEVVLVTDGMSVQPQCTADGNPTPQLDLFFGSTLVGDPTSSRTFQFGDEGTYRCVASTTGADQSAEHTFTVIISPVGSVQVAQQPIVNDDTEVTINCTSQGGPMNSFTWFVDDMMISNMGDFSIAEVTSQFSQLTISNLISGSMVNVTCEAANQAGAENASTTVEVPIQNFLDVSPLNQTVDLGVSAVFHCSNPGLEQTEYFWIRNHSDPTTVPDVAVIDLSMPSSYIIANSPYLTISDVELDDAGIFACVSDNPRVTVVEPVTLYIQPNVTNTLMEMFVEEGDRVIFPCMATGFPTPTYHWEKSDFSGVFQLIPNENMAQLIIDPVEYADFGTYRCVATVALSHDTFTDLSNDVILHVSPARSADTSPMMITGNHDDDVTLHCSSMGGPNNMYFWVRNASEEVCLDCDGEMDLKSFIEGIAMANETIDILETGPYYVIENLNATQHGGTYYCVVMNEAGYDISTSVVYVTPAFVVEPEDIKTTNGSTVAFNCEAQSFPFPAYSWEKDSSTELEGENEQTLEFDPVTFNDFGNYSCIASINVSGVVSEARSVATLFVSPSGSVVSNPEVVLLEQGDQLVLQCTAMGGPDVLIQYLLEGSPFNGADAMVFGQSAFVASLDITVNFVDAALHKGLYTCVATNMAGDGNANSTVIISPYGIVSVDPNSRTSFRGDDVTFSCETEAGPGNTYFWFFDTVNPQLLSEQDLNSQALFMGRTLSLTNINAPVNGGQYTCVAVNDAGNGTAMATLNLVPEFVLQPQDVNATAGESFNLTCVAEAFPIPSIQWQKMNRTSRQFEDIQDEQSNNLQFAPVQHADFGMYQCVATNEINGQMFNTTSEAALITVSPEGSIMLTPQNMTFDYQDQAVLICSAEGGPMNTFEWFLNDTQVVSGTNNIIILSALFYSMLTISSVSAPTHGGTYRCEVTNNAGYDDTETLLFVSPRFIQQPAVQTSVLNGLNTSLSCGAEAFPVPMYEWVNTQNSFEIVGDSEPVLYFLPALFQNEAIYQCRVYSNNLTIYSDDAQLLVFPFVISPPPMIETVNSTTAVISWSPPAGSEDIIVEYMVEYVPLRFVENLFQRRRKRQVSPEYQDVLHCLDFLNISSLSNADGSIVLTDIPPAVNSVVLPGLVPFTVYSTRVIAITLFGGSNYSNTSSFSTSTADPGAITNLNGIAYNATSASLAWNSPPCPNGPVMGYNVYYRISDFAQTGTIDSTGYTNARILSNARLTTFVIGNLQPGSYYAFHVTAVYTDSTGVREGESLTEILVEIEDQVILPPETIMELNDIVDTDTDNILIGLPRPDAFTGIGVDDIQYYGIIVVPDPVSEFVFDEDDFTLTYPNIQPYENRGNNRYYITFAWNNMSEVPEAFRAGDESRTFAIRNDIEEVYFNAKLDRNEPHCFYIVIEHTTDAAEGLVTRYFDLVCRDTDRGYHLVGLIVGVVLGFLLLCCLLLLCIIICCCCLRRRRREKEDHYSPEPHATPLKSYNDPGTVIHNEHTPPLENDETARPAMTFPRYVHKMHSNQDYLFTEEYSHIEPKHNPSKTSSIANRKKDRYLNIPAYDHSRVVLKHCPSGIDYINANHIAGYSKIGDFIATQGPMASTVADFWCMIWEQDVATIVMLTNLEENGKPKCQKYWPNSPHSSENTLEYDQLRVELLEETKDEYQVVRTFYVSMQGSVGRRVKQFHFTSWPDHGVPTNSADLLEYITEVKGNYNAADGPTVVHCSAGVGRTGAFIAIYVQLARAEKDGTIDVYNYVQYMRKQRPSMVLNETEYIFIHDALVEALRAGMVKGVEVEDVDEFQKTDLGSKTNGSNNDYSREEDVLGHHLEEDDNM